MASLPVSITTQKPDSLSIAVLIPCLNEQKEIGSVVASFRAEWPDCQIIVVDNCSTSETVEEARTAGAQVIVERRRGKAAAVISALPLIDSDILILTAGDGSYSVEGARRLVEFYRWERPDMITGVRRPEPLPGSENPPQTVPVSGMVKAYQRVLRLILGQPPADLGCEMRLFSRFFYKNIPILLRGFDLETELTVQALDKQFRIADVPVPYSPRPQSSNAPKPSRVRELFRFFRFSFMLLRDHRPMMLFGTVAALFCIASLLSGSVPIYEFVTSGIIHRLSMPVLAASLMIIAFVTFQFGVVLESSLRYRRETYQTQLRRFFDPVARVVANL